MIKGIRNKIISTVATYAGLMLLFFKRKSAKSGLEKVSNEVKKELTPDAVKKAKTAIKAITPNSDKKKHKKDKVAKIAHKEAGYQAEKTENKDKAHIAADSSSKVGHKESKANTTPKTAKKAKTEKTNKAKKSAKQAKKK